MSVVYCLLSVCLCMDKIRPACCVLHGHHLLALTWLGVAAHGCMLLYKQS